MKKKNIIDYFVPPNYELVDSSLTNLLDLDEEIFDEFGNYKMLNHFKSDKLNSAIPKHKENY